MGNREGKFTIRDAVEEIRRKRGYSLDKELYQRWGTNKKTFSSWLSRDSVPIEQGKKIALIEDISLDWFYLGRNAIRGHIVANPDADEVANLIACLDMTQRNALLAFVQSLANASPYKPVVSRSTIEMKLTLIDFLRDAVRGPLGVGANAINRRIGVIHWINERQHARFTVDELLFMAEEVAQAKGKKISLKIEDLDE